MDLITGVALTNAAIAGVGAYGVKKANTTPNDEKLQSTIEQLQREIEILKRAKDICESKSRSEPAHEPAPVVPEPVAEPAPAVPDVFPTVPEPASAVPEPVPEPAPAVPEPPSFSNPEPAPVAPEPIPEPVTEPAPVAPEPVPEPVTEPAQVVPSLSQPTPRQPGRFMSRVQEAKTEAEQEVVPFTTATPTPSIPPPPVETTPGLPPPPPLVDARAIRGKTRKDMYRLSAKSNRTPEEDAQLESLRRVYNVRGGIHRTRHTRITRKKKLRTRREGKQKKNGRRTRRS